MFPLASIVIATKDRGAEIIATIDSVLALDYDRFEVILVDNCSAPPNQQILLDLQQQHPDRLVYVRENKLGLSNARNCGIDHSKGEFILFLDDDAIVPPHWLKVMIQTFQNYPDAYALGGKVIAQFTTPAPEWLDKRLGLYISNFDHGDQVIPLKYNEYPRGVNMAFRREVFHRVGYFLDCFGRKGKSLMGYEEIELCYRLEQQGLGILYVPYAEVYHCIRGDRLNYEWFKQRFYWQGRSEGLFEIIHFGKDHIWRNLKSHLKQAIKGDKLDQQFHRGFLTAIGLNWWRF
ncbi:MAG: glycosyltransferase [Cyanobacteria bacterium KgW148]|nr:glycosyltransferase [Cyanobacteria bacterium KgW148]